MDSTQTLSNPEDSQAENALPIEYEKPNPPYSDGEVYLAGESEKQVQYLNAESGPGELVGIDIPIDGGEEDQPRDALPENDSPLPLLRRFHPESLLELTALGLDLDQLAGNGTLNTLSDLLPVSLPLHLSGLHHELLVLIEPYLSRGRIGIEASPLLKYIPDLSWSASQQLAIEHGNPFLVVKRVVNSITSFAFESKMEALWTDLRATFRISRSLFEQIIHAILEKPSSKPPQLPNVDWEEEDWEELLTLLNVHFPLQIGLFNGLGFTFQPVCDLNTLPAWKEALNDLDGGL